MTLHPEMPGHQITREPRDDQRIPEPPPSGCIQRLLSSVNQKNLSEDPYNDEVFCPFRNPEGAHQHDPDEGRDENQNASKQESSSRFREARADAFHPLAYQACVVFFGAVCPDGDHRPIHGLQYEKVNASSTPSMKQLTVLASSPAQELVSPIGM